jgi:hypothetical protein
MELWLVECALAAAYNAAPWDFADAPYRYFIDCLGNGDRPANRVFDVDRMPHGCLLDRLLHTPAVAETKRVYLQRLSEHLRVIAKPIDPYNPSVGWKQDSPWHAHHYKMPAVPPKQPALTGSVVGLDWTPSQLPMYTQPDGWVPTRAEAAVRMAESVSFRMHDRCEDEGRGRSYAHFVERWNLRVAATAQYRRTLVPTLQACGGAAALSLPMELLHLICECII